MVLAHELSFRLPVYGFKGAHESSHHHHGLSGYAGICIGDPETGDLTISEMSPEEIRAELKRLANKRCDLIKVSNSTVLFSFLVSFFSDCTHN